MTNTFKNCRRLWTHETAAAEIARLAAVLAAAEAALREAAIKVENDRTLWTPEWQTWLIDARTALEVKT